MGMGWPRAAIHLTDEAQLDQLGGQLGDVLIWWVTHRA